jgi:Arc/MetJ family transcription regulator
LTFDDPSGSKRKTSTFAEALSANNFRLIVGKTENEPSASGFQKVIAMCMFFIIFTHKFNLMRTNIELDDVLVKQAIKLSKLKTKREVVQEALKSYVASMKRRELLNLKGRVSWEGNLKEMRSL